MWNPIVVATDLSPASDQFLSCLRGLRPMGARRLILVHALGLRHLDELKYRLIPVVEPKLAEQKRLLEDQGFEVEPVIASGIPSWEISLAAQEAGASLIVIGSHGATLAREVLLGSVALEVIHRATIPVLLLHLRMTEEAPSRCEAVCHDLHEHVLFPTDFSERSRHAFQQVEQLVQAGTRRVTLLHVQDQSRIAGHLDQKREQFDRIDRERLEQLADRLKALGAQEVSLTLPYGMPKQQIVQFVEQGDCSLIVMGTQGRGYFGELLLGSVAHHVARKAVVPTMLSPPPPSVAAR
jgi:nucleotide-binding universal stress UspA family protein